jgi:hypothetical protein
MQTAEERFKRQLAENNRSRLLQTLAVIESIQTESPNQKAIFMEIIAFKELCKELNLPVASDVFIDNIKLVPMHVTAREKLLAPEFATFLYIHADTHEFSGY